MTLTATFAVAVDPASGTVELTTLRRLNRAAIEEAIDDAGSTYVG